MIDKITIYLAREFPQLRGHKLLLGASGGLDSTVLASVLHSLGYSVSLAHCNFQLRGKEAEADEAFVEEFARKHQLGYYRIGFETENFAAERKISIQMAARELRYEWFDQLRAKHGFDFILTAHHADDNLETLLINLLRGTGLDGLSGIPSRQGHLLRPLLSFSRKELEEVAINHGITWREDQSNSEVKYLRNKLRLEVIPQLKAIEPSVLASVQITNRYLQDSRAIIDRAIHEVENKIVKVEGDKWIINLEKLMAFQPVRAYLYEILKPYGFTAWADIEKLISAQSGKQIFSKRYVLLKDRNTLCLSPRTNAITRSYRLTLKEPLVTDTFTLKIVESADLNFSNFEQMALVDAEKVTFPLHIRKWEEGDYFYPLGLGGKKKISKYFKDQKLNLREKEEAWLLCDATKIIWVVNRRLDDRVAVTDNTKSILKITFRPH